MGTNIDANNSKHKPKLLSTLPIPTSTTDNYWFKALFGPHQSSLRKGTLNLLQAMSFSKNPTITEGSLLIDSRSQTCAHSGSQKQDKGLLGPSCCPRSRRGRLIVWRALKLWGFCPSRRMHDWFALGTGDLWNPESGFPCVG